ncbi:MAG: hypothetical protein ABWZ25_11530 [Chitinophagaceae bacterium]
MKIRFCLPVALCLGAVLFSLIAFSQEPLPKMFVLMGPSITRENWFLHGDKKTPDKKSKAEVLLDSTGGMQKMSSYSAGTTYSDFIFKEVFKTQAATPDAVNIYFCAFDRSAPGPFTKGEFANNELILVYAPAKIDPADPRIASDLGDICYVLDYSGQTWAVSQTDKKTWAENYVSKYATKPVFTSRLESNAPENLYEGKVTDTKSIMYKKDDLEEVLVKEQDRILKQYKGEFRGVEVSFASYTGFGNIEGQYKDRLLIDISFLKAGKAGKMEPIYLDLEPDFEQRLKAGAGKSSGKLTQSGQLSMLAMAILSFSQSGFNFDNGQLCPLNCPR